MSGKRQKEIEKEKEREKKKNGQRDKEITSEKKGGERGRVLFYLYVETHVRTWRLYIFMRAIFLPDRCVIDFHTYVYARRGMKLMKRAE